MAGTGGMVKIVFEEIKTEFFTTLLFLRKIQCSTTKNYIFEGNSDARLSSSSRFEVRQFFSEFFSEIFGDVVTASCSLQPSGKWWK
jgi:hypothetical protein